MSQNDDNSWHLSKSVPISIIIGFIMQFAGFVWFMSGMNAQVEVNKGSIVKIEQKLDSVGSTVQAQAVQFGRIEENIVATKHTLERIERLLDARERTEY